MRLFRRQGFDRTTVEQIAAATEVSPSTFFRYFPTKESVLLDDQYQTELIEAFDEQPADRDPVTALHRAVTEVFSRLDSEDNTALLKRNRLVMSTPEVRAAYMEHLHQLMTMISKSAAKRTGLQPFSLEIRTFAWTMQGVLTAASAYWTESKNESLVDCFDRAFAIVENGAVPAAGNRLSAAATPRRLRSPGR